VDWRNQAGTILFVTVVAVLIWYWAAAETLERSAISFTISARVPDRSRLLVTMPNTEFSVVLEGSAFALEEARELNSHLELTVGKEFPSAPGEYPLRTADVLREHEELRKKGVSVISADPASLLLRIDELVEVTAPVQPALPPALQLEGDVTVKPQQANVLLPASLRQFAGDTLAVEAYVDPSRVENVEPGQSYKLPATLRLPAVLSGGEFVRITPSTATVDFTVRSRIRETTLTTVAVQIAGPPQAHKEFVVAIDEKDAILHDVTVRADAAIIQQIEQQRVPVVAVVHLSYQETEQRIQSKPVTCFLALLPDDAEEVQAEVRGSPQRPVIHLRIGERKAGG
jgi:hypothetical protein